jgi:predicted ABC-type ATPase
MLHCKEFVNADNIALGLSPFNPEKVSIEAARIMLHRIDELMYQQESFAFETTLASRSYVSFIKKAKIAGYKVTMVYFWLNSVDTAKLRVLERVKNGGHDIPEETIIRRYKRGIVNLFSLYMPICNYWLLIDNSINELEMVVEGEFEKAIDIKNSDIWETIKKQHDAYKS